MVQELRTIVHRNERDWMSALSDAELRSCIDLLHRIQDRLASSSPVVSFPTGYFVK